MTLYSVVISNLQPPSSGYILLCRDPENQNLKLHKLDLYLLVVRITRLGDLEVRAPEGVTLPRDRHNQFTCLSYLRRNMKHVLEFSLFWGLFFAHFPYLGKKESMLMWSTYCLCVCESLPINFWMPEPVFIKLGMYIMAPEPISTAYFLNSSHQSVCLYVYPVVARQRKAR
jgi:hypothetical protein